MTRSSTHYTFLNKTTKSGLVSWSGIHGVQKYYRMNKLKKYIPGTNCSLFAYVRSFTYHHRRESQWTFHAAAVLLAFAKTLLSRKRNNAFPLYCLRTVVVNNTESFATNKQQYVLRIVALRTRMSLPTIWNTLRFLCKVTDFLSDFNQIWSFSVDFHNVSSIKFHRKPSGRWQSRW
jgi:hypothetical protein